MAKSVMALRGRSLALGLGLAAVLTAVWLLVRHRQTEPAEAPPTAVTGCSSSAPMGWQRWNPPDLDFGIAYPAGWRVHNADKALEISLNAEPSWSSRYEEGWTGPLIHVLHNLNRGSAATPRAELEQLLAGWLQEYPDLPPLQAPTTLDAEPETLIAYYTPDDSVLLLGVRAFGGNGASAVVGVSAVVERDGFDEFRPIFEGVLCSIRP